MTDETAESDRIVQSLCSAYAQGAFPMAEPETGDIFWYDPDPRAIFPIAPDDPAGSFHVSRSLAREHRRTKLRFTSDTAFTEVMIACAQPRPDQPSSQAGSWIDDRIIAAYTTLHHAGHAHSIEAWLDHDPANAADTENPDQRPRLVGGIYGVTLGGLFAGESMFSLPHAGGANSSKLALAHLACHLQTQGYTLFDTQFVNPHLLQFGCVEIPRTEYHQRLESAIELDISWGTFVPAATIRA